MPARLDAASAYAFGQALAPLADEDVLIIGSGSLTHNLYEFRATQGEVPAYVHEFVAWVRDVVTSGDTTRLLHALELAPHAQRAHPTTEHFLPLLVAAGAANAATGRSGPVEVLDGGFTHGVLSMESYVFDGSRDGAAAASQQESMHV
uniref:LigB family dioxygenase n=1 Tax=Sym plasmid TaxID=28430 RepID=A0A515HIP9_9ZZZZ|nr:LigB family dioxygenase [Sym plasmid]